MIARLRARLHGLRRGHQTYEHTWCEDVTPVEFRGVYTLLDERPVWRCHGCERRWFM